MRCYVNARSHVRWLTIVVGAIVMVGSLGCIEELALLFNSSSLGGDTPGRRADLNVKFVNQTGYRPVMTFGTYDPLNSTSGDDNSFPLKFRQFVIDDSEGGIRLDAFSESDVITFTRQTLSDPGGCGRAISLGGQDFIALIEDDSALLDSARPEALRPLCDEATNTAKAGIAFFRETSPGPSEDACDSKDEIAAWAPATTILQGDSLESLIGTRYPCDGGTVIITFVEDSSQEGGIRIDVAIEPPAEED